MKKLIAYSIYISCFFLINSCSSKDENCTKTATITNTYFLDGRQHYSDKIIELPCDFPDPEPLTQIEPPELEGFTYTILYDEFIPDTGNNTSRWRFEIKLNNSKDYAVKGIPFLTVNAGGLVSKSNYSDKTTSPCYEIGANASCTLTYDQESPIDEGVVDIKIVNVQYFLTN